LSVKASSAGKYLLEDPCSLFVQSNSSPNRLQGDGWGIGYYSKGATQIIRSEKPVYDEGETYASAVRNACSRIVLAHVRRASNPRGLPRERMIGVENSQPFGYNGYLFAHNGTITIPDELAETLGDWRKNIKGQNDSEVYFWYIVKQTAGGASFSVAIEKLRETLSELWTKSREKHRDKTRPYIGLNALFTDGEKLYAYCKYDKEDEAARSLCLADQPVFQMCYLLSPSRLIVSSEKTNREDKWRPLESGRLLTGWLEGNKVRARVSEVG